MKNLWNAAGTGLSNNKFIFQNNETMSGYSESLEALHEDTRERLDELKRRGKLSAQQEAKYATKINAKADETLTEITSLLLSASDPKTVFETISNKTISKTSDSEFDKMYRTEVIARINEAFGTNGALTDKQVSDLMIKSMEEMSFPSNTTTERKLYYAMAMIKHGSSKLSPALEARFKGAARYELAKEMDKGPDITFNSDGSFEFKGKTYVVENMEVLTGGAMTQINKRFLSSFKLENALMDGNQIIATLSNGCKGNLAVINIKEKGSEEIPCNGGPYHILDGQIVCGKAPGGTTTSPTITTKPTTATNPNTNLEGECFDCETFGAVTVASADKDFQNVNFAGSDCWEKLSAKEKISANIQFLVEKGAFDKIFVNNEYKPAGWDNATPEQKWNMMDSHDKAWALTYDQFEVTTENLTESEKFFAAVFENDRSFGNSIRKRLEMIQDGRTFEGGLIGWVEQIPKIFQNKDKAFRNRISRQLGWDKSNSVENWDKMMNQANKDIAIFKTEFESNGKKALNETITNMTDKQFKKFHAQAKKAAAAKGQALPEMDKAMWKGSLYQVEKTLLSDLLVIAIGIATQNYDVTLTNLKLPKWLGSKLIQLPGMNAIAATEWGDGIDNNYTEFQQKVISNLNKEIELGDNAAMLSGELIKNLADLEALKNEDPCNTELVAKLSAKIDKQNARLDMWADDMSYRLGMMLDGVEDENGNLKGGLSQRLKTSKKETMKAARHSFTWFENGHMAGDRKVLRKALKSYKKGDKMALASTEVIDSLNKIQEALTQELNDDFGSNIEFAGFGKENINGKKFEMLLKSAPKVTVTMEITKDANGTTISPIKSTIKVGKNGKPYSSLKTVRQNNILKRIGNRSDKMMARMAQVQELHGINTVISEYAKVANMEAIRSEIYDNSNETASENVQESAAFALLERMDNNSDIKETLFRKYDQCENCWFSKEVQAQLEEYFTIEEYSEKVAAFNALMEGQFGTEYNAMMKKIASIGTLKDGIVYFVDSEGNKRTCYGYELEQVLSKNETVFIYDNLVGEISHRLPITLNMFRMFSRIGGADKFANQSMNLHPKGQTHLAGLSQEAGLAYLKENLTGASGEIVSWTLKDGVLNIVVKDGVTQTMTKFATERFLTAMGSSLVGSMVQKIDLHTTPNTGYYYDATGKIIDKPVVDGEKDPCDYPVTKPEQKDPCETIANEKPAVAHCEKCVLNSTAERKEYETNLSNSQRLISILNTKQGNTAEIIKIITSKKSMLEGQAFTRVINDLNNAGTGALMKKFQVGSKGKISLIKITGSKPNNIIGNPNETEEETIKPETIYDNNSENESLGQNSNLQESISKLKENPAKLWENLEAMKADGLMGEYPLVFDKSWPENAPNKPRFTTNEAFKDFLINKSYSVDDVAIENGKVISITIDK